MLVAVKQYIDILSCPTRFTKTLGAVDVLMKDASGRPKCFVGNKSVIFKIRYKGRVCGLKCYTCPKPNLRRIYGDCCLRDELFVSTDCCRGRFVDAVITEWVEGCTLSRAIADAAGDTGRMKVLAESFDRFALGLLDAEWAHGDLKPDNIIVNERDEMFAIDFDAVWRPDLADIRSDEAGTAAFQHPKRTAGFYNGSMDDYPAALISTALHALAADESLHPLLADDSVLLIDPCEAVDGRSESLNRICRMFEQRCMGVEYRLASMLASPVPQLAGLRNCLVWLVEGRWPAEIGDAQCGNGGSPQLECCNGLWGYVSEGRFVIPPVYDLGFEFSEGLAAVRCGSSFHYIDTAGRAVVSLGECDWVKPFRNGRAVIMRHRERITVDRNGTCDYPPPPNFGVN